MSKKNACEYLTKFGLEKDIIELDESTATVELAAKALGCHEEQICKTMSFMVGSQPIVILMSGAVKVDNTKFKEVFKQKAKMIARDDLGELVGHEAGGVCPFGVKENVDIYLDISLKNFDVLYPAAGEANVCIKLKRCELENILDYKDYIDIGKST